MIGQLASNFLNLLQSNRYILAIVAVSVIILKGVSLWQSARNSQKYWYIALLLLNTLGLLEIIYLIFFSKIQIKRSFDKIFSKNKINKKNKS